MGRSLQGEAKPLKGCRKAMTRVKIISAGPSVEGSNNVGSQKSTTTIGATASIRPHPRSDCTTDRQYKAEQIQYTTPVNRRNDKDTWTATRSELRWKISPLSHRDGRNYLLSKSPSSPDWASNCQGRQTVQRHVPPAEYVI